MAKAYEEKLVVRNGGFELGNFNFWELKYGTDGFVQSVEKHRGNCAYKATSTAAKMVAIKQADFVDVRKFNSVTAVAWVMTTGTRNITLMIYELDADGNPVLDTTETTAQINNTWTRAKHSVCLNIATFYVVIYIIALSNAALESIYIDDFSILAFETQ